MAGSTSASSQLCWWATPQRLAEGPAISSSRSRSWFVQLGQQRGAVVALDDEVRGGRRR